MVKEVVFTDQSRASSYNLAVNTPHNPIIKVAESAQVFSSTAATEGRVRSLRLSQVWNSSDDPWSESLLIPLRPPPSSVRPYDLFICSEFTACEIVSVNSTYWDRRRAVLGGRWNNRASFTGGARMTCAHTSVCSWCMRSSYKTHLTQGGAYKSSR